MRRLLRRREPRASRGVRAASARRCRARSRGSIAVGRLRRARRAVRHADVHFVARPGDPRFEASPRRRSAARGARGCWRAPSCCRAWWRPPSARYGLRRIACTSPRDRKMLIDTTPRLARRLDAVIDGVLEQRLQHQRRHQRVARHALRCSSRRSSRSPRRSFSRSRYCRHSSTSSASGASSRLSRISTRKRSAMSSSALSARRGSLRTSDSTRVDAVEQEMRPDARLQRLQPRLGDRRRQRAWRAGGSSRAAAPSRRARTRACRASEPGASPSSRGDQRVDSATASTHVSAATIATRRVAIRQPREPRREQRTAARARAAGAARRRRSCRRHSSRRTAEPRLARERDDQRRAR